VEVQAWTQDKTGGVEVGSSFFRPSVHVWKADAQLQSLAQAKKTQKKVPGCLTHPVVREESDHLVFDCTMKSIPHGYDFLMLVERGGVMYACASESHQKETQGFEPELEACRSLKAL
jgi:hypothetical protein